jgi:hypothetical protein
MGTYDNNAFRSFNAAATADLRNYLTDVHTGMTSSGWAVASDTGQIDEATIVNPGSAATSLGYRMYYLNDSQHGTYPIYLKRTYAMSTSSASRLRSDIQIGISTNGAGTFTNGTLGTTRALYTGGTGNVPAAGTFPYIGTYGEGYATVLEGIAMWSGSSNYPCPLISVAREFDQTTGDVATNGNFTLVVSECTASAYPAGTHIAGYNRQFMKEYPFSLSTTLGYYNCFVPLGVAIPGTNVELFSHTYRTKKTVINPTLMSYQGTDIATDSTVTGSVLGVSRTYRATGVKYATTASTSTYSLAVLWE